MDPRDRAIAGQSPVLIQPHFEALPPLDIGHHRYLFAKEGVFLEAKTHALYACVQISQFIQPSPFGSCQEKISLTGGLIPELFMAEVFSQAVNASPNEYACLIMFDPDSGHYKKLEPECFSHGHDHIIYDNQHHDPLYLGLDLHTHGDGKPYFSKTDNQDDLSGIHLSTVLGYCHESSCIKAITRLCVHGRFFDLNWNPW